MSEIPSSEKIVGLFATFRENEAEIERMEAQLKEKTIAQEKTQRELDLVSQNVTRMEADHHRLRRTLIKAKEAVAAMEPLLAKEKEAQFTVYTNLVDTDEAGTKIEQDRVEDQLKASRDLLHESDAYLRQRRSLVDNLFNGLRVHRKDESGETLAEEMKV